MKSSLFQQPRERFASSTRETRHLWGNCKGNSLTLGKAVCLWAREPLSNLTSPTRLILWGGGAEERSPLTTVSIEVSSAPLGDTAGTKESQGHEPSKLAQQQF